MWTYPGWRILFARDRVVFPINEILGLVLVDYVSDLIKLALRAKRSIRMVSGRRCNALLDRWFVFIKIWALRTLASRHYGRAGPLLWYWLDSKAMFPCATVRNFIWWGYYIASTICSFPLPPTLRSEAAVTRRYFINSSKVDCSWWAVHAKPYSIY